MKDEINIKEYFKLSTYRRREIKDKLYTESNRIICPSCQEIKHENHFELSKSSKNGRQVYCMVCRLTYQRKEPKLFSKVFISKNSKTHKKCHKCLEDKPFSEFCQQKNKTRDGLSRWCNYCKREYESNNREHLNSLHNRSYHKHKDKISKAIKLKIKTDPDFRKMRKKSKNNWDKNNKKHRNEYARKYSKTEKYRRNSRLRAHISKNRTGISFSSEGKYYLGCTPAEFFKYLENQNPDYLNGKLYHLDHIIPFSVFDFRKPEHKEIAFNYRNVQPLHYKYNSKKKDNLNIARYYLLKQIKLNSEDEFYDRMLSFLDEVQTDQEKI